MMLILQNMFLITVPLSTVLTTIAMLLPYWWSSETLQVGLWRARSISSSWLLVEPQIDTSEGRILFILQILSFTSVILADISGIIWLITLPHRNSSSLFKFLVSLLIFTILTYLCLSIMIYLVWQTTKDYVKLIKISYSFYLVLIIILFHSLTFIRILIGFISHFLYWLLFDSFGRYEKQAKRKLKSKSNQKDGEYYAIVIGTGFSGLGTAIKLNELGVDNYILIERNAHVGGTWYANKYPGCACDVPSNLYSFSFQPNPNWSHFFGRQPEIAKYLEHCTDKYDIRRHIHFNTTVTQLKWIEKQQLWQVTTRSDDQEYQLFARIVIAGSGPLSNASYPRDIDGIDKFKGEMCHTAEWNKAINFENKRVVVIGTGASAIQAVPEIHKMGVKQLLVFQRTPPWVIPRIDRRVSNFEKQLFTYFPFIQKFIRKCIYWSRETLVLAFAYRWPIRFINQQLVQHNLNQQIKDLELRKKVTPTWELGCKRTLISSDWYPTLGKPNVKLITNRIQEIKEYSIVTYDGDEYPVDIIIWSTGFEVHKFSIPVYGIKGCSLADQWSETMQAYRGMAIPNFPNFFILLGPNSRLGHSSVIIMLEAQLKYLIEILLHMDENNIKSVSIKQNIHDKYNQWIQSKLKQTVWYLGGCHSWYQDANGNVTTIWPDFTWMYHLLLKNFDYKNFILQK
ncbi:unnamed protein product [Adineta steineri]|uniref:Flavin-containing monooxygenase n=1 Tax=Adineta steineri TaxID=433720 RepID=A0A815DWI1_9BILA|nr:unnamed protein product [Adineta steineri]